MSGDNNASVGVLRYNAVCPSENVVVRAVFKGKNHIGSSLHLEVHIVVIYLTAFVVSGNIIGKGGLVAERSVEARVVRTHPLVVSRDKRVRNFISKLAYDKILCICIFSACRTRSVGQFSVVNDIAKPDNILNVLRSKVVYYIIVNVFGIVSSVYNVLIYHKLRITDYSKRVIVIRSFKVLFKEELLHMVSIARCICNLLAANARCSHIVICDKRVRACVNAVFIVCFYFFLGESFIVKSNVLYSSFINLRLANVTAY